VIAKGGVTVIHAILFAVLVVRPQGLLGRPVVQRV